MYWISILALVTLSWNANDEPDLAGYRIYQGSESEVYTVKHEVNNLDTFIVVSYIDGTGEPNYFAATAYDTAGNESSFSTEVVYYATPPEPVDSIPAPVVLTSVYVDSLVGDSLALIIVVWEEYTDTLATAFKLWDTKDSTYWDDPGDPAIITIFYQIDPSTILFLYTVPYEPNGRRHVRMEAANRSGPRSFFSEQSEILSYTLPDISIVPPDTLSPIHWFGDVNDDCFIDGLDQMILSAHKTHIVGKDEVDEFVDLNHDGIIDGLDQMIMSAHKRERCP